jgi:hypothetical protein
MISSSALKWRHDIPHNDTRCTVMLSVVYTESRKYAHYAVPEHSALCNSVSLSIMDLIVTVGIKGTQYDTLHYH